MFAIDKKERPYPLLSQQVSCFSCSAINVVIESLSDNCFFAVIRFYWSLARLGKKKVSNHSQRRCLREWLETGCLPFTGIP